MDRTEPSVPRWRALVRPPPATYAQALTREADPRPVDIGLALDQHAAYVAALRQLGVAVTELPPDERFPDSCFVQDPAFALDTILVVGRPGAPSRRHEEHDLVAALAPTGLAVYRVTRPATLEGGDLIITEDKLYVGLSGRTNRLACEPDHSWRPDRASGRGERWCHQAGARHGPSRSAGSAWRRPRPGQSG